MENLFTVFNLADKEFKIPTEYLKAKPLPDDPPDSVVFEKDTQEATNILMFFFIDKSEAMPFGDKEGLIACLHNCLGESQGLIEVETGKTGRGTAFVYTIVKSAKQTSGVQYILTLQLNYGVHVLNLQGYFDEEGTTGTRDATIYEYAMREGIISKGDSSKWVADPHCPEFQTGLLMNLSEDRKFDEAFPAHPLTELRQFVSSFVDEN